MKIAVLGTGNVGRTLASRLVELGHDVCLGSRTATNEAAAAWAADAGERGSHGTFATAAEFGELALNCTSGEHSVAVIGAVAESLAGKVLMDLSNPLDFSRGMPPTLFVNNDDSLAERIQRAAPVARVVKTLNTLNADLMVHPRSLADGDHDVFLSGDDEGAKTIVADLLRSFGWRDPLDLGDLSTARGVEMWLPLWLRLYGALGTARFQLKVVR
ncbi:MAG: NAD(P)-binding domain-containing protein [Myxococcota bacterium]